MTQKTVVLIVDDDADLRKMLRIALDNGKRTIHEADSVRDGLRLARDVSPDILLLDVGLRGGADGFALSNALSRDPGLWHVKTIVISGHDRDEDIVRADRHGVDAYMVKPFSPGALVSVVERFELQPREMLVIPADPELTARVPARDPAQ